MFFLDGPIVASLFDIEWDFFFFYYYQYHFNSNINVAYLVQMTSVAS